MKFATLVSFVACSVAVQGARRHGHLKARQSGGFITSPCTSDSACASGCCGFTSAQCEAPCVALERDGCGQGTAAPNANAAEALGECSSDVSAFLSSVGSDSGAVATPTATSSTSEARGTQFITGPCETNNDCVSGCCVTSLGTCGAVGAQANGAADCQGGTALPNLDGGAGTSPAPAAPAAPAPSVEAGTGTSSASEARGTQFITGPCETNNDCVSGCCVTSLGTCGAVGAQANGAADCQGGTALPNLDGGAGTSPAPAAPAPSVEAGTGTSSASGARGSQFITGPCATNNDCVSGCCVTSLGTCGAVGAQANGAADCEGGTALPNLDARWLW